MRVIGGKHRGRRLRTVEGLAVRPTSDRLRETLFNILAPRIEGSRFLDICAGSGAVGIEALSRGAGHVTFVERSPRACAAIRANLDAVHAAAGAVVVSRDAESALRKLAHEEAKFDVVFFDPPYASELYHRVMRLLGRGELLSSEAIAVVEHRTKQPPEAQYGRLRLFRKVKQGESTLTFYECS